MITNFLLRLVTRDADAIIDFVERLRDKLNALIIQHAGQIGEIEAFIEETISDAKSDVASIKQQADDAIAEVEAFVDREVTAARTEISKIGAKIESAKALATKLDF